MFFFFEPIVWGHLLRDCYICYDLLYPVEALKDKKEKIEYEVNYMKLHRNLKA